MADETVRVRCIESRYIATTKYDRGREYSMPAERAGKYMGQFDEGSGRWGGQFEPMSRQDADRAQAAWAQRLAEEMKRQEAVYALSEFDPSILAAAAQLVQAEVAKRLAAREV
jgi:hypothetical protein